MESPMAAPRSPTVGRSGMNGDDVEGAVECSDFEGCSGFDGCVG
jgi:hypothetical protein